MNRYGTHQAIHSSLLLHSLLCYRVSLFILLTNLFLSGVTQTSIGVLIRLKTFHHSTTLKSQLRFTLFRYNRVDIASCKPSFHPLEHSVGNTFEKSTNEKDEISTQLYSGHRLIFPSISMTHDLSSQPTHHLCCCFS